MFLDSNCFTFIHLAEKKAKERKINILLLIQHYLKTEGYIESYNQLVNESKLPKEYEICDNMELNNIIHDYESYYFVRFQKYPKISKKVTPPLEAPEKRDTRRAKAAIFKESKKEVPPERPMLDMCSILSVKSVDTPEETTIASPRLHRPLASFQGYSDEWRALAEVISREIVVKDLEVKWDDIVGLDQAKSALKEALVYPWKYPQVFEGGAIAPWRGLLLYGPSGTGKTLLAKAVATECETTFFNISASTVISKWRGDSEKLIRVMFDLARLNAPSTIFLDELDAVASKRGCPSEHEASRRLKSELLIQLDGLAHSSENIFFLTTSNLPWDLDFAVLRRLEKRIFVGPPEFNEREELFQMYLPKVVLGSPRLISMLDYRAQAMNSEGYSGAEIELLCKEVKISALREMFEKLEAGEHIGPETELRPITEVDMDLGRMKVKSVVSGSLQKYLTWREENGT